MKNFTFFLMLALVGLSNVSAQTLEWAKQLGGASYDENRYIIIDGSGHVYTTGYFQGTADFDPGPESYNLTSAGGSDIFISKLDASGNFVWAKQLGGTSNDRGYSIAIDSSGNIYTMGDFYGIVDFDPGAGTYNLTSAVSAEIYISKLDALGNFVWAKQLGGVNTAGYSIAVDSIGNVYIIGIFFDPVDFDPGPEIYNLTPAGLYDIFISKLDAWGNFVWAKQLGGTSYDDGRSIVVDGSGNVYTTGYFYYTADFDPGAGTYNLTSAGNADIFISKLDAWGNFVWAKQFGGASYDAGRSIVVDGSENVYTTGYFYYTADFDPDAETYNLTSAGNKDIFISKLDALGNFVWAKQLGGIDHDIGRSIAVDGSGNVYTTGYFQGIAVFDPGPGTYNLTSAGLEDIFISKLDASGNFVWAKQLGGTNIDYSYSIALDSSENVYITGNFSGTANFDSSPGTFNLTSAGENDIFILKLRQKGVTGFVFNDINQNCARDANEIGLQNRYVIINPGNIIAQTNSSGAWVIDTLQVGTYTATADTSGHWAATCPVMQTFTVTNPNEITYTPDFGFVSTQPCASPDISVNMPFMRPCFSNQKIYVIACNQSIASGALDSAYADVELDSLITSQSASLAYTGMGNNIFRFQLGNLNPGQCVYFTIDCHVSCDAMPGLTLCMQANLYPADSCMFDTVPNPYPGNFTPCNLPWDHSSLEVTGYCQNDTIYFVIYNTGEPGEGDMDCYSPVRIYIDGVYTVLDSVQLAGGDSIVYVFPGDGHTWRLEADQHPLHPGNSAPNATVEACGDLDNWTSGLVTILPADDADPVVDIYCGVVTASYDPNDKTGFPTGVTENHYVMPNQQLQYVIRFQNTGTDTAFSVVLRDTLDTDLDIFSVVPGVASHNYNFQLYGSRVLEWTLYNILLPDSNHNEVESHGFVTFTVNQNPDLPNGTIIYNEAGIYFDYNASVSTNPTLHTVNDEVQTILVTTSKLPANKVSDILVWPNPANSEIDIIVLKECIGNEYNITDIFGR
ncbi:MAG: SBBP repeat-containing protein, partial [Bacteroidia bacterium]|nr:SBBP repeat-containing protein [Bacteroidia bacterium]